MTTVQLEGTTLSAELLFFVGSIGPAEPFHLTQEEGEAVVLFLDSLSRWAASIEATIGTSQYRLAECVSGMSEFFIGAARGNGISLDEVQRHHLFAAAMGAYHLAKEAESMAPFEPRFPDWKIKVEAANDAAPINDNSGEVAR